MRRALPEGWGAKRDALAEENPEALMADGFEAAYIGPARRCAQPTLAAYSMAKAIALLGERDGLSYEEAVEHLEFNVLGAWLGEHTPVWIDDREE